MSGERGVWVKVRAKAFKSKDHESELFDDIACLLVLLYPQPTPARAFLISSGTSASVMMRALSVFFGPLFQKLDQGIGNSHARYMS